MFERVRQYFYRLSLKMQGVQLQYPIRGRNFLFGSKKNLVNGSVIMIEQGVKFNIGDDAILKIADFVYINSYTIIDCYYRVEIGKRVQIGPHCYISDFDHDLHVDIRNPFHRLNKKFGAVTIQDNVWLGAGVIVLKGVTIGKNSVIAAGTLVNKDIPENVVAAGVPARIIRKIENNIDDDTTI